ncbi:DNA repair protein rad18 [Wilcoxina mikolae CBS 423.85]|nr:DNA repair protein rad18 [Wilcoxina mikolae CBS 423.85]
MVQLANVSDPSDWKSTNFPFIASLDAALRCEICKDFYTAPVITNCCHTFCSLCIRRALHADGICPICRTSEQEYRLRKNTTVQDLLDAFAVCRPQLYDFARKEREDLRGADVGTLASSSQWSQQSQRQTTAKITDVKLSDDDDDKPKELCLVPCPICSHHMNESCINSHLDKCIESQDRPRGPPPTQPAPLAPHQLRSISSRASSPPAPLEPLPKLTYSFLSERQLRQKLRELGVPDSGSKRILQQRHTEWMNLWNANVDSLHPQSKRELLNALDMWEKAHVKPSNNKTKTVGWSDEAWSVGHRHDFSDLIERAKRNVKRPKLHNEETEKDN